MRFAFLDEAGDTGGSGSRFLVVVLLVTPRPKEIEKQIWKVKQRLYQDKKCAKWLDRQGGEVCFYGFPDKGLLKWALSELSKKEFDIYVSIYDKGGKTINALEKANILSAIFEEIDHNKDKIARIVADNDFLPFKKMKSGFFAAGVQSEGKNALFQYKTMIMTAEEFQKTKLEKIQAIRIEHKNSHLEGCLQAADLISGAIFQSYEKKNTEYDDIIAKKVVWRKEI